MPTLADLAWEREESPDVPNAVTWFKEWWIERAIVSFANGWQVSIIKGPRIFPRWREGLYEAMPCNPTGTLETRRMVRGDEAAVQELLADVERIGLTTH